MSTGFLTSGWGGRTMKKVLTVKTNDPKRRQFRLVVRGPVEKIADIVPSNMAVNMKGRPGDMLTRQILITPSPKYPFSILGVRKKNNKPLQVKLIEPDGVNRSWRIEVSAHSEKADSVWEVLEIKTDSKLRPVLYIRVYAVFTDRQVPEKNRPAKP